MKLLPLAVAAGLALALASSSRAVTVTSFDNFTPGSPYASWATGTLTGNPTSFRVQATGFGGAYTNLTNVNAAGNNTVQLDASVTAGTAGFVIAIGDTTGHEWNYAWYGNPAGNYVFTKAVSDFNFSTGAAGQLDLANIDYIHTQIDPGAFAAVPYDVSYNDLSLISVPEPASLAACTLAGAALVRRRR